MNAPADLVTILTTFGLLATKVIGPGPDTLPAVLKGYDNAEHFRCTAVLVTGLEELRDALERLAGQSRSFVIRGEPLEGVNRQRCVRHYRKEPVTFREEPRRWLMIDADDVPEPAGLSMRLDPEDCVEHVLGLLPEPFHDASCFWQASACAGDEAWLPAAPLVLARQADHEWAGQGLAAGLPGRPHPLHADPAPLHGRSRLPRTASRTRCAADAGCGVGLRMLSRFRPVWWRSRLPIPIRSSSPAASSATRICHCSGRLCGDPRPLV